MAEPTLTLEDLRRSFTVTGSLAHDVTNLLLRFGRRMTASHCRQVAVEAATIARQVGVDHEQAVTASWLHDISAVFSPAEMLSEATRLGLDVLPEERLYPAILHQKLSSVLARELFAVSDPAVLDAIGCHTTLRASPTALDMVVYVADKLAWDRPGAPPYGPAVRSACDASIRQAALTHLAWMHGEQASLQVVHPWLRDAYETLSRLAW
jgi:predicted HD superfamily hydrolase involved in NAD metabolism